MINKLRQLSFGDYLRSVAATMLLIGAGAYIAVDIGISEIIRAFEGISRESIGLAGSAVLITVLLSCFRYIAILKTFGIRIGWRSAFFANLIGIFGGLLFFQIVGQTITRAAVLKRHGITNATVIITNLYERFIALAWLTVLATIGALFLYGSIAVDWSGSTIDLLKLLLFAPPAIVMGIYMSSRRVVTLLTKKLFQRAPLHNVAISSGLTIATHFSTMLGYLILLFGETDVSPIALASATVVVMFAASLPISFAGWGIRELSAALAFTAVGVETEMAVAIALIIGLINLIILILAILLGFTVGKFTDNNSPVDDQWTVTNYTTNNRVLTRVIGWIVPVLCSVFVMMQLQIPIGEGAVNVNAGDPLALLGGIIFLLAYFQNKNRSKYWRLPRFEGFYVCLSLVLVLAFFIGLGKFGLIDWALINRLIGWGIIFAYLATGALIASEFGYTGQLALARCFVFATITIVAMDVMFITLNSLVFIERISWLDSIVAYGLSNNPNSYALQVLFSIVLLVTMPIIPSKKTFWVSLAIAVAIAGVFYAKSRTGYGTLIILMVTLLLIRALNWRVVMQSAVMFAAIIALPFVFFHGSIITVELLKKHADIEITEGTNAHKTTNQFMRNSYRIKAVHTHWDAHRWHSIRTGLDMWRENRFFGSGLGAFIYEETKRTQTPLVIHSTPVWVLTELGIIGFIIIYGAGAFYLIKILPAVWARAGPERALFGLFIVFAVYQLPHDIFYQRTFWLLLGCLVAKIVVEQKLKATPPINNQPIPVPGNQGLA